MSTSEAEVHASLQARLFRLAHVEIAEDAAPHGHLLSLIDANDPEVGGKCRESCIHLYDDGRQPHAQAGPTYLAA